MSVTATAPRKAAPARDRGIGPRRWTREEFHRAAQFGVFGPEERLELLEGEIIAKMTQKPLHASRVARVARVIANAFGSGYHARAHSPIVLNERGEPEPDVVIVAGTEDDFAIEHPRPADILLLVEVSDTTLGFDRGRKRAAYARAGVLDYWIVNLRDRQLEVYRDPDRSKHQTVAIYHEEQEVIPLAQPTVAIRVADLLPRVTLQQEG